MPIYMIATVTSSGPITLFTDNFTGTAGTALNTYNADYTNWYDADCEISTPNGGICAAVSPAADYITGPVWTGSQFIQMTLAKVPTALFALAVNATAPYTSLGNGYFAGGGPNINANDYFIFKNGIDGAHILTSVAQTPQAGDVINFANTGAASNNLVLTVNGTVILTATDSTYTAGNPGFMIQDSGGTNRILSTLSAGVQ